MSTTKEKPLCLTPVPGRPCSKKDDAESEGEADAKVKAGDIDEDLQDGDDDENEEA